MDMNFFITLLPLIGLFLGWGLTQFTNYFNIYVSDKRILKETLYFLLELYQQITTVKSIEQHSEEYLLTFKKSIPNITSNDHDFEQALSSIRKIMAEFHSPRIENELDELNENYDKCLLKLATVDPINAYRLKGKNKIISYLNKWNNYAMETIMSNPLVIADPKAIQFSEILTPKVEIGLLNESLTDLKEIIEIIADKIGGKTKKEFLKLTLFSDSERKIENDERLKKYIDEIMIPTMVKMQQLNDSK